MLLSYNVICIKIAKGRELDLIQGSVEENALLSTE